MLPVSRLDTSDHRTSWLELFYDLVFVAAVSQLGNSLVRNLTLLGFWKFLAIFIPVWWCWSGATNFASRYQLPELTQRFLTLLELMAVALMACSINEAFIGAYQPFVWGYALVRLMLIAKYTVVYKQHVSLRPGTRRIVLGFSLGMMCALLSLMVPAQREWFWLAAFAIDLCSVVLGAPHLRQSLPNAAHLPERFGLFTLIVLGESVVAVVNTLQLMHVGIDGAVRGFISLMIAFAIWWLYFDGLNDTVIRIAQIHKRMAALNGWIFSHLVLFMGLSIISVGVRLMIPHPENPLFTGVFLIGSTITVLILGVIHLLSLCPTCTLPLSVYIQHLAGPMLMLVVCGWHWTGHPVPATMALLMVLMVTIIEILAELKENKTLGEETAIPLTLDPV
jgi:low temperature requirement protein LtrA